MPHRLRWPGWLLLLAALLCGCSNLPSLAERTELAERLAAEKAWHTEALDAGRFRLASYLPDTVLAADVLTVYIEGDGLAWLTTDLPSNDPTPMDPLALRLALAQGGAAAYLGRPCQYTGAEANHCEQRYWTGQRFAPEVIEATLSALDQLKHRFQARSLRLVGYSGGATVAALAAARRSDVVWLLTVAGNLDTDAWTRYHGLQPLTGSLNPANEIAALQAIPQIHFVGGRDGNVIPEMVQSFVLRFPATAQVQWRMEPAFDHRCCWTQGWAQRLAGAIHPE